MIYTSYKNAIVYNSQANITFPRGDERPGFGVMIYMLASNRNKSIEAIEDERMKYTESLCKRYITDTIYRYKFHTTKVNLIERTKTDKAYSEMKDFPLNYVKSTQAPTILDGGYNVLNDLSRWMELFFANTMALAPARKCEEFVKLLTLLYGDNARNDKYGSRLMVFDIDSWVASAKACVIMNAKLLNNPLSILMYTAFKYPDVMEKLPDIRLMIVSRASGQLIFYNMKDITKENYPKIKAHLTRFNTLVFSTDDTVDPNANSVDKEVKAVVTADIKKEIFNQLKYNLLGVDVSGIENDPDDISAEISDDMDDTPSEIVDGLDDINDQIHTMIDTELESVDDLSDINTDEIVSKLETEITQKTFMASFIPERTPEQIAKNERLMAGQETVLQRDMVAQAELKSIPTTELGSLINTRNPTIQTSRYANFDSAYTKKMLQRNIDSAVSVLASADAKIFITGKEVVDSSTPMDLKETYTYELEDEKGNKMSLKFDIPKVIDDNYVYLNGTKKNINHQFILKPLVKTGPDTVQVVTAYNKVFIRRMGKVNQNTNRLISYLGKNAERYSAVTGICHSLNTDYDLPLDYIMMSRQFSSFKIDSITYNLEIAKNISMYKRKTGKDLSFDKNREVPIGYDASTKSAVILKLDEPYLDKIYSKFDDAAKKSIGNIKRKPRLLVAKARIMSRDLPLVLFMMFCEGFSSVMKKADIEYKFIPANEKLTAYDKMEYDFIKLADGYVAWKKSPLRNEMLMNGLKNSDMTNFTMDELESKDTFISLIMEYYPDNTKFYLALDNYKDFLLDDKTKDILADFGYPTDLVSLMVVAAGLLCDNNYYLENDMHNMRVRSNEVISDIVYLVVTGAYNKYRSTSYKKKPTKLSVKPSIVIDKLLNSDTNMIEEFSTLNPILELEKRRAVTFKGIRGIQMSRAMTLPRRAYNASMLGTVAITTSPDANVGVVRQLTMEPNITSVYGYIDSTKGDDPDQLNAANLFSIGELINPFGVTHDDPDRTAMNYTMSP